MLKREEEDRKQCGEGEGQGGEIGGRKNIEEERNQKSAGAI